MSDAAAGGIESAARPEGARPLHYPCFDGLRAIAALTVLVTHVAAATLASVEHPFGQFFARFDIGVAIFFVISGFLLHRPFAAAHLDGRPGPAVLPFFRRRFLRIFPAYWAVLAVALLTTSWTFDLPALVSWATLFHIYRPETVLGAPTLVQSWSLGTEISFYLFLPVYAAVLARIGRTPRERLRAQLAGVVVLYAASLAFRTWALVAELPDNGTLSKWLIANTDYFALGMVLAVVRCWIDRGEMPEPAFLRWRFAPTASWALAGLSFWVVSTRLGLPGLLSDFTKVDQLLLQLLYGVTAFFLLLPAVFGPQDSGLVRRFLRARVMVLLGLVSYGIYLWQNYWLNRYEGWTDVLDFNRTLLAVTVLTVATAAVSYVVVERPALSLKAGRRRPAAAAPATAGGPDGLAPASRQ
jgi:peptidoglycan/LPS O-acetylase OafA/YrhL